MEAVVWRKLGVFRRWPAFFSGPCLCPRGCHSSDAGNHDGRCCAEPQSLTAADKTAESSIRPASQFVQSASPGISRRPVPCTCRMATRDYSIGDQVCIRGQRAICDRVLNTHVLAFPRSILPIVLGQHALAAGRNATLGKIRPGARPTRCLRCAPGLDRSGSHVPDCCSAQPLLQGPA
jgi:hypothetical protein